MSELRRRHDLVVIGGGAAGLAAVHAALRKGIRPLMVQDGPVGGECTFTGCVPSKTLISRAGRGASFEDAMTSVNRVVADIAATESAEVLERRGIEVLMGRASFLDPGRIEVEGQILTARRCVIATGTSPEIPPVEGLSDVDCLTTDTVFGLSHRPRSLAVVGGGAVGCELAQTFGRLGSRVVLLEGSRLLSSEDPEAAEVVRHSLRRKGIDVREGERLEKAEATPSGARLLLSSGDRLEVQRVLIATGRTPSTQDLCLEAAGVETDDAGYIRVDERLRTTGRGIWAAGDVTGLMPFTHAADEMGRMAAQNALGARPRRRFDPVVIPRVTFTDPEVAHVGVSESEVAGRGGRVAVLPMSRVDRAHTDGRPEGFVKLVAAPRPLLRNIGGGRLVGATIVGGRAGELIHEAALALRTGMFAGRLAQTVHAYPTWSVAVRQAAAQLLGEFGDAQVRDARVAEQDT